MEYDYEEFLQDIQEDIADISEDINLDSLDNTEEVLESETQDTLSNQDIISALKEILSTSSGVNNEEEMEDIQTFVTSSGADETNYTQYIYDYLTDSEINVNVTNTQSGFLETPINNYTVEQGLLLSIFCVILGWCLIYFIKHNVYKWG